MAYIAVKGCTLACAQGGTAVIDEGAESSSIKISNKGIYNGIITVSVSNSSAGGAAGNATGKGTFTITNSAVKGDKGYVLVQGDKAYVNVAGSTAVGVPTTGVEVVTITAAGQTDVNVS